MLFLLRNILKTIVMGQVLSLLICGTAVSSQYLASAGVETPMLQSFLNYVLLLLIYTTMLSTHKGQDTDTRWTESVISFHSPPNVSTGDRNIIQILRTKWWKYLIMGVADVEANYTVVKAYQFTSITSIQVTFVDDR